MLRRKLNFGMLLAGLLIFAWALLALEMCSVRNSAPGAESHQERAVDN